MSDQELLAVAEATDVYDPGSPLVTTRDVVVAVLVLVTTYPLLVGWMLLL